MKSLILASASPFRKELLARLRIPFETFATDIDETPLPNEDHKNLVFRLSEEKARAAALKLGTKGVYIGSDEVASFNGEVLGKPLTFDNALKQLKSMQGKTVIFYTGVSVFDSSTDIAENIMVPTTVVFRQLNDAQLIHYLKKEQPFNSAGSFKSETLGSALIEKMESSDPTAIIGLPLVSLCPMLEKVGIEIL